MMAAMDGDNHALRKEFDEGGEGSSWQLVGAFRQCWEKGQKTRLKDAIEESFENENVIGVLKNIKDKASGNVVVWFEVNGPWISLQKLFPLLEKHGDVNLHLAERLSSNRPSNGPTEMRISKSSPDVQDDDDADGEKLSFGEQDNVYDEGGDDIDDYLAAESSLTDSWIEVEYANGETESIRVVTDKTLGEHVRMPADGEVETYSKERRCWITLLASAFLYEYSRFQDERGILCIRTRWSVILRRERLAEIENMDEAEFGAEAELHPDDTDALTSAKVTGRDLVESARGGKDALRTFLKEITGLSIGGANRIFYFFYPNVPW